MRLIHAGFIIFLNTAFVSAPSVADHIWGKGDGPITTLHEASYQGDVERVRTFLRLETTTQEDIDHALIRAANSAHINVVRLLLTAGADTKYRDSAALVYSNSYEIAELLIQNGAEPSADESLALRVTGDPKIMEFWLQHGADVHAKDDYTLWLAIGYANGLDRVRVLLRHGADVNARDGSIFRKAVMRGYTEIVKLFIEYGADVHAKGGLALVYAVIGGHTDIVELLLECGADPMSRDGIAFQVTQDSSGIGDRESVKIQKLLEKYLQ